MTAIPINSIAPRILITGGCGFIGCNIADALADRGDRVTILDNLARPGSQENAEWLRIRHGDKIAVERADIRDEAAVNTLVQRCSGVIHLAAQVAVTTSLDSPIEDFEINARGTLNVLESVRKSGGRIPVVFASTNKVYGRLLSEGDIARQEHHYRPLRRDLEMGVNESTRIDFYSPYGCSKGAADQYVRDYARVFGLRTAVLRMSCIYGPRQFGTEDQGWIAHFLIQAIRGEPITIYGNGYQVRDALFVKDAVRAWIAALDNIDSISGQIFNLGGGPTNAISLREMMGLIEELRGESPMVKFEGWRPGDQPWYVSDIRAIAAALGWAPRTGLREGVGQLNSWLTERFGTAGFAPLKEAQG